jgi:hypothetical protein
MGVIDGIVKVAAAIDAVALEWAGREYLVSRWVELAGVAALFALVLMLCLKIPGLGSGIRPARRRLLGTMAEIVLYRRRPWAVVCAEAKLVRDNLRLLAALWPMVLLGGGMFCLAYAPLRNRYGFGPIAVGSDIVARVRADAAGPLSAGPPKTSPGLEVAAMVRSPARRTAWYRLAATQDGRAWLEPCGNGSVPVRIPLSIGASGGIAAPRLRVHGWDVHVWYPRGRTFGTTHGWAVYMFGVMAMAAWPLGRVLGVRL